ncbi:hypothetical protein CDAR_379441 [Caerostris darwini]|uniref:Transmembrane protein n=1 Tax=Caerostris darwini TaxID=1538125 RepID=A0AAV4V9P3_9ARAC|nr:hypothetical protein CDAR_379441 [Caerostris darwini]
MCPRDRGGGCKSVTLFPSFLSLDHPVVFSHLGREGGLYSARHCLVARLRAIACELLGVRAVRRSHWVRSRLSRRLPRSDSLTPFVSGRATSISRYLKLGLVLACLFGCLLQFR